MENRQLSARAFHFPLRVEAYMYYREVDLFSQLALGSFELLANLRLNLIDTA